MQKAPQDLSAQEDPVSGSPLFHLAHKISRTFNDVRLRQVKQWGFVPQTIPYQGYGTTEWVRVLGRVLLTSKPLPGARTDRAKLSRAQNVRGWRSFTSVPLQYVDVEIEIGDTVTHVRADRGGLVDTVIAVHLPPGANTAVLRAEGTEPVEARIQIISAEEKFGIVSDIDDTVMVTALPRPFLALWNTFVLNERARTPTPGMAVLLDRLAKQHPDAPIIYLSTGPWNAAPTLARFLARNMYPTGALLLTDWGLTQDRWFRSGQQHKNTNLDRLATEFPETRWLLIGDSGQHDEEIYSRFASAHPNNVAAIAIRQLSPGEAVLAGAHAAHGNKSNADVPWLYSPDGAGLAEQLQKRGLV